MAAKKTSKRGHKTERGSSPQFDAVSWVDALARSVESADWLFKELRSLEMYYTAMRAQLLRDNLEKLRRQIESASTEKAQ